MAQRQASSALSLGQMIIIVGVVIATYFVVDLGRRAWDNYLLRTLVASEEQQIRALEREIERYEEIKARVMSPAFVEQYARQVLGWVREGEVAVFTVPPLEDEAEPELFFVPQASGEKASSSYLKDWWSLFFRSP